MKKLIFTLIFGFVLAVGLKAQTEVTVPENLSSVTVILGTTFEFANWEFNIEDGVTSTSSKIPVPKKVSAISNYSSLVAQVANKLAKQGYKLISSNTVTDGGGTEGGGIGTVYIFQKE